MIPMAAAVAGAATARIVLGHQAVPTAMVWLIAIDLAEIFS